MSTTEFMNSLGQLDLASYVNICIDFMKYAPNEEIMEVGYNSNSGYVYIALENGVTIASAFNQEVEYIITNFETGEEHFCETYNAALNLKL
jgi:hypothetical protein